MTILKEVSLPNTDYYAPAIEIAAQVEIDKIAEFYSQSNEKMKIFTLGSKQSVNQNETVYVVAHGNARGQFTKMSIQELRCVLKNHGVIDDMDVILAGCFTKVKDIAAGNAVKNIVTDGFNINVDGYVGVLNVVETGLSDLVNNGDSAELYSSRTGELATAWKVMINSIHGQMTTLKGSVSNANSREFRDFFELSGYMDHVLYLKPIKFGGQTSAKSIATTVRNWFHNNSNLAAANAFWPPFIKGMSLLARYNDFLSDAHSDGADGTGKTSLINAARIIDNLHSKLFSDAESIQYRYQETIDNKLPKH